MKIRFIRHGDPDYVNDTLTEKGRVEAALSGKGGSQYGTWGLLYVSPWKSYGYSSLFPCGYRKRTQRSLTGFGSFRQK